MDSLSYMLSTALFCAFHATALVLSLVYWKRYPNVCVLVLAGSLLNLLATVTRSVLPMMWFRHFDDQLSFGFANLGISLVNVLASGLYLLAIFTGRTTCTPRSERPTRRYVDDDWDRPATPPPAVGPGNTGIQQGKSLTEPRP